MAAVWITRFINSTNSPIQVSSTDSTWRPWVYGRQLAVGEQLTLPPQRLTDQFIPIPGFPNGGITIPKGPVAVDTSYWFVGWVDFSKTDFVTPNGRLMNVVGPQVDGNDWLRTFDSAEREVAKVECGPRGAGWVASVDFHVTFDEAAQEVRWNYWNANGIGANILARIDQIFTAGLSEVGKALFKALFGVK
jgi:hypothetical protein